MTSHVTRLYATAVSVLGFFLAWAGIAAHPWAASSSAPNPAADAVAQYEQRLQFDAALVQQLEARRGAQTAAPPVRIVTLPPLTTTRSS
jgi:hypothetical protein